MIFPNLSLEKYENLPYLAIICTFADGMTTKSEGMVIGYDAKRIVRNGTGLGSYGRTLINDIARDGELDIRLYAPDAGRDDLRRQIVESPNVRFCYPERTAMPFGKSLWRSRGIVKDLLRDKVQIFHGLSGELPHGIRKSGIKSVVTIHDLIFLRHPEFYHWIDTKIYTRKFRQTLQEADRIIAISECTKRDIMEYGNIDDSRISLIYQSCAPRFSVTTIGAEKEHIRQQYGLPERFILNVGSIETRKNILLAVKALPYLPENLSLVIVGRHTKYTDEVRTYIEKHRLTHRVHILHGVPDSHLPALYALAETFVYPSRYEGFGIPIIEAIRCGLPVVACTGSCLEEAGGPDCLYVHPDDEQAMAVAISQTFKGAEGREQRITRAQEYIRRFDGNDVAGQVIELYHRLLS